MSIIPASQARKQIEDSIKNKYDRQVSLINSIIKSSSDFKIFLSDSDDRIREPILSSVVKELEDAGYSIKYFHDQREGNCYTITW